MAALDSTSTPVQLVAAVLLWLLWGGGVVAVLVPRVPSLTLLRIGAPAALAAAVWAVVREPGALTIVSVGWCALTAGLVLVVPTIADRLVDGSSYGPERRMCLRIPAPLLLGPVELAWAAVVCGVVSGPLLLAAKQWVPGVVCALVGAGLAAVGLRSLHQLSRRWVVFVPAGFVVHDPVAMLDPVLFPKRIVAALGPARPSAEGAATDATAGAGGLVLELRLHAPAAVALRTRGRRAGETVETDRLLFAPTRPGAVLAEARRRGLPVAAGDVQTGLA